MLRCLVASWPRCFPCKPGSRFLCGSRFTFHGPRSQTVHGSRSQLTVHCSRSRQTAHTINNNQKQLHNTKQQAQPTTTTLHSYMSCLTCFLYDLATSPPSHQAFKKGAGGMGAKPFRYEGAFLRGLWKCTPSYSTANRNQTE